MRYTHKLTYLDVKRVIEATKEAVESAEVQAQINKKVLALFEMEIEKLPKPKLPKIEEE